MRPHPLRALEDAARQGAALEETAHRPWPLPDEPWAQGQTWERLLFAHWRVEHDELRPHVPAALELETFDGSAWIGLTPFRVSGLRVRGLPPAPVVSTFLELNCRTYVRAGDRAGIWFFSLHASSRLAVAAARLSFRLPYVSARMAAGDWFAARSRSGAFAARYAPTSPVSPASPGTLEYFLCERYCLYSGGGTLRSDIQHRPWPLQRADAEVRVRGIAPVTLEGDPLCHFARRQDTLVWRPVPVSSPRWGPPTPPASRSPSAPSRSAAAGSEAPS